MFVSQRFSRLIATLVCLYALGVAGCGQTGPLVYPGDGGTSSETTQPTPPSQSPPSE